MGSGFVEYRSCGESGEAVVCVYDQSRGMTSRGIPPPWSEIRTVTSWKKRGRPQDGQVTVEGKENRRRARTRGMFVRARKRTPPPAAIMTLTSAWREERAASFQAISGGALR